MAPVLPARTFTRGALGRGEARVQALLARDHVQHGHPRGFAVGEGDRVPARGPSEAAPRAAGLRQAVPQFPDGELPENLDERLQVLLSHTLVQVLWDVYLEDC